ncbi:MAG TPA: HEPN domain-containing protein [Candidatus Nanoarchaeia archaeon]|nr:HEPN domain-containing protein [Candidatus Nanoarchaeia archaeon]
MNSKEILLKALERQKRKERGLRLIQPNKDLAKGHLAKADHNLVVMTDLKNLNHTDWVVTTAYYAMYHAATAILAEVGLDSKDHATTVAVL